MIGKLERCFLICYTCNANDVRNERSFEAIRRAISILHARSERCINPTEIRGQKRNYQAKTIFDIVSKIFERRLHDRSGHLIY